MAEALYRRYRPQVFEDVVGQEPIERTLKNAIEQDKVSHAYLFTGPRGTGKTTTARLLAKALLCEQGPTPDPDGVCEDCQLVAEGLHPDVYELDAASRTGVENVREEIISRVQFAPTRGRYKVYIIDEVHMLSNAAFNALLKTLEEPPSHVVFILCTTDPQKVPETIHSRCQRFDFRRIAPESMVSRLGAICMAEGVEFEGDALDLIAHRAEGGLRNALTSLEQIIAFENGKVTLQGAERLLGAIDSNDMAEIMAYVGKRDIANCFRWTANYVETGADLAQFVRDMAEHVRNLYVLALVGDDVELDVSEMVRRELTVELQWYGPERLSRLLGVLADLTAELKTSSNPRLAFEIALTRMVRPDSDLTLAALAERVEALESGYSAVAHVLPGEMARPEAAAAPAYADGAGQAAPFRHADQGAYQQPASFIQQQPASEPVHEAAPAQQQPGAPETQTAYREGAASAAVAASGQTHQELQGGAAQGVDGSLPTTAGQAGGQNVHDNQAAQHDRADIREEPAAPAASAEQASPYAVPATEAARAAGGPAQTGAPLQNSATLQRIWQAALAGVRKHKQAYGVLFMGARASYDAAADRVKVSFPEENAFAFNAVQKPDVQDCLAEALQKAAGFPVSFYYEKGDARTSAADARFAEAGQAPVQEAQPQQQAVRVQQQNVQPQQQAAQVQQQAAQERRPDVQAQTAPHQEPQRAGAVPVQEEPYDYVPYDDYDRVPYEEFGASFAQEEDFSHEPIPPMQQQAVQAAPLSQTASAAGPDQGMTSQNAGATPVPSDESTGASPIEHGLMPDGSFAEDPADLQALLREGFGGGVVFSEIEE